MTEPAKEKTREDVLKERLADAQEKRKQLAENRALVTLEQSVADEEALAALDLAYPDGYAIVYLNAPISGCPGFVAARDCDGAQYKRYQAGVKVKVVNKAAEVDSGDGAEVLARVCLISPDLDTFKKMCEARSGLAAGLGGEVLARAQTRKADDAKK